MFKRGHFACLKAIRISACVVVSFLSAAAASAANDEGQYAVRGIGSVSCGAFLDTVEKEERLPVSYVSWMSGYVSALNRFKPDTFDVSYITQNDAMLTLALRICATDRDILLETAIARLINFMKEYRLESETELLRVQVGERQVVVRQSIYDEFVDVLVKQGFLEEQMEFSEQVRDAVLAFQEVHELKLSGLPDENTLVTAFSPRADE